MLTVAGATHAGAAEAAELGPEFVRGMTFAHIHSRSWGYGSDRARAELEKLRAAGVSWIAISPFAYQRRVDTPSLYSGPGDPTLLDSDLVQVSADAHALGLKVLLKPHLWSGQFWSEGKWTGDIAMTTPEDDAEWWRRYSAYILDQADLAARANMDALLVGHELVKLTTSAHTARWRSLIAEVRRRFRGPLSYGAHHEREVEQVEFWDALDVIGVHGYFPLGGAELEQASADQIAAAWRPHLERLAALAARARRDVVFTEIGFPAHAGALREPWAADGARPEDEGLQARAYEGTLRAIAAAPFVRGTFWWKWFSGGRGNPHENEPFDPSGRAAEKVLARWYRGGAGQ